MPTARVRERGGFIQPFYSFTYTRNGPTTPGGFYDGYTTWNDAAPNPGAFDGVYERMVDVVDTKFIRGSKIDSWVNNPGAKTRQTYRRNDHGTTMAAPPNGSGQYLSCVSSGDLLSFYTGPLGKPSYDWSLETTAYNEAAISCLARIEPPKSQSLVTVAEADKTVKLILDRTRKLARVIDACRQGRRDLLKRLLPGTKPARLPDRVVVWDESGRPIVRKNGKPVHRWSHKRVSPRYWTGVSEAAKLWMEYRYGWRVLVYDIVDQAKACYAQELRNELLPRDFRTVTGVSSRDSAKTTTYTVDWAQRRFTLQDVVEQTTSVRAFAYYRTNYAGGVNSSRLREFGVFDVPRTIWELVPASFIADWIAPVGDWLLALTPKIGVEVFHSGYTVKRAIRKTRTLTGFAWTGSTAQLGNVFYTTPLAIGSFDQYEEVGWERYIGLPTPGYPPIRVQLNASRLIDALAIFSGKAKVSEMRYG
jgi:hypothetical protein